MKGFWKKAVSIFCAAIMVIGLAAGFQTASAAAKFQDAKLPLVDEAVRLDAEKRAAQQECEQLKAARNKLSKANGPLYGQLKKADEAQKAELQKQIEENNAKVKADDERRAELEKRQAEAEDKLREYFLSA